MMIAPIRLRALAAGSLLGVASLAACSDPVSPRLMAGMYVLANPASVAGSDFRTLGDTLLLRPDGTGRHVVHWEILFPTPSQSRFQSSTTEIEYRVEGIGLLVPRSRDHADAYASDPIVYLIRSGTLRRNNGMWVRQ